MLDQMWNLDAYSWEDQMIPPVKLYCTPID